MGCGGSKAGADGADGAKGGGGTGDAVKDKKADKADNKEFAQIMSFLSQVTLFQRLPKDQHPLLAAAMVTQDFKAGETIIKQGESGSEFFVIRTGEAAVSISNDGGAAAQIAVLKAGDFFGENSLLHEEPRTATIIAQSALSTLKINRAKFVELELPDKLQFANRKAVGIAGGAAKKLETKPPSPKSAEEKELIKTSLSSNENLQMMAPMNSERITAMTDICWKETIEPGTEIIKEGDLSADYFYVVQDGEFEVLAAMQQEEGQGAKDALQAKIAGGNSQLLSSVKKGGSFGELALLYYVPRAATVKAKVKSTVWVFDRVSFKNILMKVSDKKVNDYVKILEKVEILACLLADEKKMVAGALIEMYFQKGEMVLQQGEPGSTFYILYDGEVSVTKDGKAVTTLSAEAASGSTQYFGEQALLENDVRSATVQVTSQTGKALALDRESFNQLLGPLKDIIEKSKAGSRSSCAGPAKMKQVILPKVQRKDLVRIGLLGCGGFGTVELYEHKVTQESYAMKGLSKGYIVKTGMQDSVMNEKMIQSMLDSPFIVKLFDTYNGAQTLYFLLEVCLGGELYATYNRKGLYGSEKHAKFYIAGVILAFDHCHVRRIIHRDLKPENVLMNDGGFPKLTDMGLAKFVIGKTYSTCGTPDYFAPELIASIGHTNALDWWCLGVLIFELMGGAPPFESASPMHIYAKVMKGIGKVNFPAKCQGVVETLIKALLKKEPSERLPMRPGGIQNLKTHKWFEGFDWAAFAENKLAAPYKPVVKSKKDCANFNCRKEDCPKPVEYHDDGSGWDKDF